MKTRCSKSSKCNSKNYSDRGIKVCDEWQEFEPFKEWAENNGYDESLTLDRINVNGDYCPENCRWIPIEEQQLNKRCNVRIEYNGKIQTIAEWSRETGLSFAIIHWRYRQGKTGDELFEPIKKPKSLKYNGEEKTVSEIAEIYGVHVGTIYNSIYEAENEQDVFKIIERKVKKHGVKR